MRIVPARGRFRSRAVLFTATLLGAALVTAACGGGSSSSSKSTSSGAGDAILGPAKAATGTPVKIGFVSDGQTAAIDTTDETKAAEAAAAYANARLGGIAGHPIQVVSCYTQNTPAQAQACGNTLVGQKVSAIAAGTPGQTDPWMKVAVAAKVPAVVNLSSTQVSLTTPGVFDFSNPLSDFGTPAAYARANKVKSAAFLVIDVPSASGPAKQLVPLLYANAGSQATVVPIAPGTADMTPQVEAAQAKKPGMYFLMGDPTFCSSALKAIRTLGISAPVLGLDRCIGTDKGASVPGGFKGVGIVAQANVSPAQKEDQLFNAVLKDYGKGLADDAYSVSGYQGMLALIRAVNASGVTDTTPAGITKALKTMPATPYPLGGGSTFQCNGKALPGLAPNVCSANGFLATAASDGSLSDFRTLDTTGIYKLPAAG